MAERGLRVLAVAVGQGEREILALGAGTHPPGLDTKIAASLIAQAAHMIATINRYRLALLDPDACGF